MPSAGLTTIPRSKRRSLQAAPERIPDVRIDKKKEPVLVSSNTDNQTAQQSQCDVEKFNNLYEKWTTSRLLASKDQVEPNFAGFCVKSAEEGTILEETKLTYLPPINAPITDFPTTCKIFEVIQKRAGRVNMQYANITFDIGAAINAHKVLWNYPERFKNIIIHLGDFHFMKEIFAVLGKLVCGSGFEDVVFQTGICSSGSLNGVLSGFHYNRYWTVHSIFAEALERLLFKGEFRVQYKLGSNERA